MLRQLISEAKRKKSGPDEDKWHVFREREREGMQI